VTSLSCESLSLVHTEIVTDVSILCISAFRLFLFIRTCIVMCIPECLQKQNVFQDEIYMFMKSVVDHFELVLHLVTNFSFCLTSPFWRLLDVGPCPAKVSKWEALIIAVAVTCNVCCNLAVASMLLSLSWYAAMMKVTSRIPRDHGKSLKFKLRISRHGKSREDALFLENGNPEKIMGMRCSRLNFTMRVCSLKQQVIVSVFLFYMKSVLCLVNV